MITLLLAMACSGGETPVTVADGFTAADYQFWTTAAVDGCLDGALRALFMPEGLETSHPFEYLVYVPSPQEMPLTYEVSFRAPFVGMEVSVVDGGNGSVSFDDSLIESVLLNDALYGDCTVDMVVSGLLVPEGDGTYGNGTAILALQNAQGSEGRCPPLDSDPCRVELTIFAEIP
jgi:hypothetical protein